MVVCNLGVEFKSKHLRGKMKKAFILQEFFDLNFLFYAQLKPLLHETLNS